MLRKLLIVGFGVLSQAAALPSNAKVAKSLSYELEYASVNAGSANTQSASYSIVSIITTDGVAGGKSTSSGGAYTIEPAIGSSSTPSSGIDDWMLY